MTKRKNKTKANAFIRSLTLSDILFIGLLVAFVGYSLLYIYRTSFLINGERTFALFDDAMISMRYARNFAEGLGLTWNPGGERVEGFSNPLWVLYMSLFHLVPIPVRFVSLAIQLSGLFFLLCNLLIVRLIAQEVSTSSYVPLAAVFLTGFYYPLNTWSLQGMEVSALVLLVSWSVLIAIRNLDKNSFTPWPFVLMAIGTLLRIDAALPFVLLALFLILKQPKYRQRHGWWTFGLLLLFLGGQTLARYMYFGDVLPNTFYLKLGGVPFLERVGQGMRILGLFVWDSGWLLMLLPLLLLFVWPSPSYWLLSILMVGQLTYSVYTGGDSWDHQGGANRFISIAMPLFFVLFCEVLEKLREQLAPTKKRGYWPSMALMTGAVIASWLSFNTIRVQDPTAKLFLRSTPIFVGGTARYAGMAAALDSFALPQAKIAVVAAGNIPYFHEGEYIDLLGKNDLYVAHLSIAEIQGYHDDFYAFQPGHVKWDLQYSLNELKPDIVAQLPVPPEEAEPFLANYQKVTIAGIPYYLLNGSPNINWENLP